jgi:hypothetical protein
MEISRTGREGNTGGKIFVSAKGKLLSLGDRIAVRSERLVVAQGALCHAAFLFRVTVPINGGANLQLDEATDNSSMQCSVRSLTHNDVDCFPPSIYLPYSLDRVRLGDLKREQK